MHTHYHPAIVKSGSLLFPLSSRSPVPVRGLWYCFLMRRLSPRTCSESGLLRCVQRRRAGLCPRANCCYLADSLSVLHSHWLPGLWGDSHRHPKTNKPGRTIDNGCKSYRSAQLLIKILWERVRVCVYMGSISVWRCLLIAPSPSELTGIFSQSLSASRDFDKEHERVQRHPHMQQHHINIPW